MSISYITLTAQGEAGDYTLDMTYTNDTAPDAMVYFVDDDASVPMTRAEAFALAALTGAIVSGPVYSTAPVQDRGMFDDGEDDELPCGCSSGSCYCDDSKNLYDADYSIHHLGD